MIKNAVNIWFMAYCFPWHTEKNPEIKSVVCRHPCCSVGLGKSSPILIYLLCTYLTYSVFLVTLVLKNMYKWKFLYLFRLFFVWASPTEGLFTLFSIAVISCPHKFNAFSPKFASFFIILNYKSWCKMCRLCIIVQGIEFLNCLLNYSVYNL